MSCGFCGSKYRMFLRLQIGSRQKAGCSCLSLRPSFAAASGVWRPPQQRNVAHCLALRDLRPAQAIWHGLASGRRQLSSGVQDQGEKWSGSSGGREFEMDTGLVDQVVKDTEPIAERYNSVAAILDVKDVQGDKHGDPLGVVDDGNVNVEGEAPEKQDAYAQEKRGEETDAQPDEETESATVGGSRRSAFPDAEYFELTPSCKLVLQSGDITEWCVNGRTDAIVNAANERMLGGGGVDGAIHAAAGSGLYRACRAAPEVKPGVRCPTGQAVITDAFDLPVAKVIHTVGPVYKGRNPAVLLASAYENSVKKALEAGLEYVCFPAISCGIYSYPHDEAAKVAFEALQKNSEGLKEVHFVLFDSRSQRAWFTEAHERFKNLTR